MSRPNRTGAALLLAAVALGHAAAIAEEERSSTHARPHIATPIARHDEPHLANIRKLTSGGENAEAYWSPDGAELVFQSTRGLRAVNARPVAVIANVKAPLAR